MGEQTANLVTSAMADVSSIYSSAVTMVTGNAVSLAFIGIALAGAGLGLFRRTIHTR